MSVRLSELVLNCDDPEVLSRFWCAVLDYVELGKDEDGIEIGPASGFGGATPRSSCRGTRSRSTSRSACTSTSHRSTRTRTPNSSDCWHSGAPGRRRADRDESWHVLQDPEGNEFCLLRTRLDPL